MLKTHLQRNKGQTLKHYRKVYSMKLLFTKKVFFVVLYRGPSQDQQEFDQFVDNLELMLSRLSAEEPYAVIISGDFNCRFSQWRKGDKENDEGKQFEPLTSDLGLHQMISGQAHMIGESKSCIDLILTDKPYLCIDTGIHHSLHEQCHHQIINGKLSVKNLAPLPYIRKLWYYDKAAVLSIGKRIEMFH